MSTKDQKKIIEHLIRERNNLIHSRFRPLSYRIPEKVNQAEQTKRLKNYDFAQNIDLKRKTLKILFIFLCIETVIIFFIRIFSSNRNCI